MPEIIEVGDIADTKVAAVELTKADFVAMTDEDKVKVLIAEKEAELEAKDIEALKSIFYETQRQTLEAFDADAKQRLGTFESQLSQERTVIEKKFKDAVETGTWEIPL